MWNLWQPDNTGLTYITSEWPQGLDYWEVRESYDSRFFVNLLTLLDFTFEIGLFQVILTSFI